MGVYNMADSTPDSDIGSIECFQNYTAPEVFVQGLAGQINQQDVEAIIIAQKQMLQRFEKTNEMLSNCNALSITRFTLAQKEFKKHTTLLLDMKKDLDSIFKRIRTIKTKLSNQHPSAFAAAVDEVFQEKEEDEDITVTCVNQTASSSSRASQQGENAASHSEGRDEEMEHSSDPGTYSAVKKERQQIREKTISSSDSGSSSPKLSSSSSFDN